MARQWLRYRDLVQRGVVKNRMTLSRWIKTLEFPEGVLLGPPTRAWAEDEIKAWEDRRRSAQPVAEAA